MKKPIYQIFNDFDEFFLIFSLRWIKLYLTKKRKLIKAEWWLSSRICCRHLVAVADTVVIVVDFDWIDFDCDQLVGVVHFGCIEVL